MSESQQVYHYRSGGTKQELKGAALDKFLLRKQGRTWDSIPVPYVTIRDLSKTAIAGFRKLAKQSRRLDAKVRGESIAALIDKLHLIEGTHLKRAAVLLFHPEPERYISGAFVKVGYFRGDSELLFHDEIRGDLFSQAQRTLEVLASKYLKAAITYEGIQRIEKFPVPEDALREALLNALIHRDYSAGAPIQIRVSDDRLSIWNPGELPEGWSVEKLRKQHASRPFNPTVANAFFRAGEVEVWGRGIQRIFAACREAETPEPQIRYDAGELWFEFPFSAAYMERIYGPGGGRGSQAEIGERIGENFGAGITQKERTCTSGLWPEFAFAPSATARVAAQTPVETPVETPVKTPQRILVVLRNHPEWTLVQVAEAIGKSQRAVERATRKLVESGRLRHTGPTKAGSWEVLG